MLREDTVKKLTDFGLSVNQAKVYLSILQDGPLPVNRISTTTSLHRQDIYKILPKLERKGLITKRIGKPVMLSAIQPGEALTNIISLEEKKANEKTTQLKMEMEEILRGFEQRQASAMEQESSFVIITGDDAVANKVFEVSASGREQIDVHFSEDLLLRYPKNVWRTAFRADAQNGVKQRLLVGVLSKEDLVKKLIESTRPPEGAFLARIVEREPFDEYMVVDHREAFMTTQKSPVLSALLTNSESVVRILEENFEALWNDSRTKTVCE